MITITCDQCKKQIAIGSSPYERFMTIRTAQGQGAKSKRIANHHVCSVTCAKKALKHALNFATLPEDP